MARTGNHSIRFDEDKLAFFKGKNPTIEKPQDIIDYFLDEFWWKHQFGNNPVLDRQDKKVDKLEEKSEKTDKSKKIRCPRPKRQGGLFKVVKRKLMATYKIYGLLNPVTEKYFYVGLTCLDLKIRLNAHMSSTDKNREKVAIIQDILSKGKRPQIVLLEEMPSDSETSAKEAEYKWTRVLEKDNVLTNKDQNRGGRNPCKNPKKQVNLYISEDVIDRFGGKDNLKKILCEYMEAYGKELSREMYTD